MSQIKIEKMPRPGSLKDSKYPLLEMTSIDEDSFFISATTTKEIGKYRNHVASTVKKWKDAGKLESDFTLESITVKEGDSISGVRFWRTSPKNIKQNSNK